MNSLNIKFIIIGAMFIAMILIIIMSNIFIKESKIYNFENENLNKNKDNSEKKIVKTSTFINISQLEKHIFDKINLDYNNKTLIFVFRALVGILLIIGCVKFSGPICFFLLCEVYIIILFQIKYTNKLNENGVNSLFNTNTFLDSYIPAISSGSSVDQAMLKFINKSKDEKLLTWWYDKNVVPSEWEDAIKIYESGKHSEELGLQDNASRTQEDILMKVSFYNNLERNLGETAPILGCFNIGIPALLFVSYSNYPDFWKGTNGIIDCVVITIMFLVTHFFFYNVKASTLEKLF